MDRKWTGMIGYGLGGRIGDVAGRRGDCGLVAETANYAAVAGRRSGNSGILTIFAAISASGSGNQKPEATRSSSWALDLTEEGRGRGPDAAAIDEGGGDGGGDSGD
uniref:DUF834 domain-containing protein n=1 Tax=Oryza nivara TaxID=4536 RepID=A0A0E0IK58_ORYNI